jgi:hypothetical protein
MVKHSFFFKKKERMSLGLGLNCFLGLSGTAFRQFCSNPFPAQSNVDGPAMDHG